MATQQEPVSDIRVYFSENYRHIDISQLSDIAINDFMVEPYITPLPFEMQMNCLKDYIMANGLTDIQK